MNKLMLMGSAALLALSGTVFAQTTIAEPAPDAATVSPPLATPAETPAAAPAPDAAASDPVVAQSTEPAADAAAMPSTIATATAEPAPVATSGVEPKQAASAEAAAKVNAEWANYDEGNKGKLTPLEFGNWIMAAKGQDVTAQVEKSKASKQANLPAVKVLNETATDFAKADTDKDRMISPNELAIFLSA